MRCLAVQMAVVITPVMLVSACMGGGGGGHSLNINDRSLNINDFERVSPDAFRSADAADSSADVADSSADVAEGVSANVQNVWLSTFNGGDIWVRINVKDGVDAPNGYPQGGIPSSNSEVTGRKWVIGNQSDHRANGGSFIRTFADYDENDYTDNWIAGGFWMRYTTVGGYSVSSVEAFVDGPEFRSAADLSGTSGTAKYTGVVAKGFHTFDHTADRNTFSAVRRESGKDVHTGGYTGDFSATYDFATNTVTGSVNNIHIDLSRSGAQGDTYQQWIPARLVLGAATINADGSFTGTAQLMYDGEAIGGAGSWGSRFSSVDDGDGNPRAVIGTHSLSATSDGGARASFVGAHVGTTGEF